ncbi:MAG TPA: sulfur oxidation c-type cytochrome SoxX [Oceanospirillaceae bacterium]|nr:sulfur oxidation c-type cytochrome SoxX [Oceanospirillaceae bacterium]
MRKNIIKHALLGLALIGASSVTLADYSADDIAKGKALYLNKKMGNCIACHMIPDADAKLPGNQGPPLLAMKARFPDAAVLRAQIWDASVKNPMTIMPPFGRHWILSEADIDAIVAYLYQY